MNYLAHIVLSGNNPLTQLGGFAADGIKGRDYLHYPPAMQEGVLLHRFIDHYTDTHPAVISLKRELQPALGRYSGVVLDLYFDFLLASRFEKYTGQSLRRFARRFYIVLLSRALYLPPRYRRFFLHFILTNRLGRYATINGLKESMDIMVSCRELPINTQTAVSILRNNEERMRRQFEQFYQELRLEVTQRNIGRRDEQ